MELFERIMELCAKNGTTISKLEKDIGFNHVIYKWNKQIPSVDRVKVVADYFGVTVDSLIGDTEKEATQDDLLPEHRMLLSASKKLNKEDIEFLIQMAKRMGE